MILEDVAVSQVLTNSSKLYNMRKKKESFMFCCELVEMMNFDNNPLGSSLSEVSVFLLQAQTLMEL